MTTKDLYNKKILVHGWSKERKVQLQAALFRVGFSWGSPQYKTVSFLDHSGYYLEDDARICYLTARDAATGYFEREDAYQPISGEELLERLKEKSTEDYTDIDVIVSAPTTPETITGFIDYLNTLKR